ncbi:MAG: DEAD/DEAH box helicase [Acidobacteriota bacterium]|nr:MAG: DEAD/DEAH box helicase [Acidobacteriota bacterium]
MNMSKFHSEPVKEFDNFYLNRTLMCGISEAGFVNPRPIQAHTIPAALDGRDILGLAQTGTGKTAAFALPALERILQSRKRGGPRVLVVAPTRELAGQIEEEIKMLAKFTSIKTVTIFGGVSAQPQISALRKHPEIIVACPGRLLDLHRQGEVALNQIEILILDEADHMFDMGFLPDIRRIIAALPAKRQNLLFSATMPEEIRALADRILHDPHVVDLNNSRPVSTIEHALYPVENGHKPALLENLLSKEEIASAIVFTRTKHRAKRLAQQLSRKGHRAVALQGNMTQSQRVKAMEGFRKRRYDILVATDIAARGIDVQQVSHVVNFDMPSTVDAYTHRIGRTGRAEREGKAYTFVTHDDHRMIRMVEKRIGASIERKVLTGFETIPVSPAQPEAALETRPARRTMKRYLAEDSLPGEKRWRPRKPRFRKAS